MYPSGPLHPKFSAVSILLISLLVPAGGIDHPFVLMGSDVAVYVPLLSLHAAKDYWHRRCHSLLVPHLPDVVQIQFESRFAR